MDGVKVELEVIFLDQIGLNELPPDLQHLKRLKKLSVYHNFILLIGFLRWCS